MSHTFFETEFTKFKEKFPPATYYLDGVTVKMTMQETIDLLSALDPAITPEGIHELLTQSGYSYEPIEFNGHIGFYWLFGKSVDL
jgi:hypothetical protein